MQSSAFLFFPPFHLDLANERLWHEEQEVVLRAKTFAVLRHLVVHTGQLVTKEDLLNAVWPNTYVSEGAVKICIQELRKALQDDSRTPQFIETVHRRGYRFIAPLTTSPPPVPSFKFQVSSSQPIPNPQPPAPKVVGRATELAQLQRWLENALQGERQVVFVTGEPGIGKTTLVDAFLHRAAAHDNVWVARGQCIEHYGPGEAYMPVLEALERQCRLPGGKRLVTLLRQHAPLWLAQMSTLLSPPEREALQRELLGAARERMLREIVAVVEILTADIPLVLVLEDLQWSDASTLELIASLARRREAARLLLIGTYRPEEMVTNGHPLNGILQELKAHRLCVELPLTLLSEAAVAEYLTVRFASPSSGKGEACPEPFDFAQDGLRRRGGGEGLSHVPLRELAQVLYRRTEGNPLFMVQVVEDLGSQGVLTQADGSWVLQGGVRAIALKVPESIQQLFARLMGRLSAEEQRVLQAASVIGIEFSAMAVAAALEADVVQVEEWCEALVCRHVFLQPSGRSPQPERRQATRYRFLHSLHHSLWYDRLSTAQRRQLHQRIREREEQVYGARAGEIATELAVHFAEGRDYGRAVRYLKQAAGMAAPRYAYWEAIGHLSRGLELLAALPDTPERAQQELDLQIALGAAFMAIHGYGAADAAKAYARARELSQQVEDTPQLFPVRNW